MITHTSYDTRNQLVDDARWMCVAIVGLWLRPHANDESRMDQLNHFGQKEPEAWKNNVEK